MPVKVRQIEIRSIIVKNLVTSIPWRLADAMPKTIVYPLYTLVLAPNRTLGYEDSVVNIIEPLSMSTAVKRKLFRQNFFTRMI